MTSYSDPAERLERAEAALIRIGAETFDPWARAEAERVLAEAFGVPFECVPDESAGLAELAERAVREPHGTKAAGLLGSDRREEPAA